jgi:hypothetical protein
MKIYCRICKKKTKNHKEERCPLCLDFRGHSDYRSFVLSKQGGVK